MGQKPWPAELDKALWLKTKGNVCFSTKPELISKTQLYCSHQTSSEALHSQFTSEQQDILFYKLLEILFTVFVHWTCIW